ncbi:methyltransferase domain-containing protein [Candidatus Berkiella aquae]|uniref:Class I SAM-dependent methyltransferase n=1 Tax=Candidatus Berkiella aquae TaxID=295108 RepID=A0A0Q9YIK7_9GAMM|nr:methyltransferase domain-containing protein [Candidatus Berkiella aquae]MCS5712190.1 class I SAM-dependent methyltransferase [Candidatus Berkiella aquae]
MELWEKQASRWRYIGAPLRPDVSDIQTITAWVQQLAQTQQKPLTVLLLGTTPEIAHIVWPSHTRLIAVDSSFSMMKSILPSQTPHLKPEPVLGNWCRLPFADTQIDLVIGDGCFTVMQSQYYAEFINEIKRVLNPIGSLIVRFFMRPACSESIEIVQQDFVQGKISNFNILKWRIAMALHGSLVQGVCLKEIWDCWYHHFKMPHEAVIKKLNWSYEVMDTINNYHNCSVYYTFPDLEEIKTLFHEFFKEEECYFPRYPLGERCPSFLFSPI